MEMTNGTLDETTHLQNTSQADHSDHDDTHTTSMGLYVGLAVAIAALICILVVMLLLGRRKFRARRWSVRSRRLFLRGFSTVSQRGVLESSASFEVVNVNTSPSISSDNGQSGKSPPKKPERRKTKSSASAAKYENVCLDPSGSGYAIRKSASMVSDIPYMDGTSHENKAGESKEEDDLDDVFT